MEILKKQNTVIYGPYDYLQWEDFVVRVYIYEACKICVIGVYMPLPIAKDRHAVSKSEHGRCIDLVWHRLIITKNLGPRFTVARHAGAQGLQWKKVLIVNRADIDPPHRWRKPSYLNGQPTSHNIVYIHPHSSEEFGKNPRIFACNIYKNNS